MSDWVSVTSLGLVAFIFSCHTLLIFVVFVFVNWKYHIGWWFSSKWFEEKRNWKYRMIERCMCGYPPIILVHLSVGARAFSIILSGAHHQQNNIMLWINQSLIYVLSKEKNTKWNRNRFRSYIQFFLFLLLLMLCLAVFIKNQSSNI